MQPPGDWVFLYLQNKWYRMQCYPVNTKWPPFCRSHFQSHFNENVRISIKFSLKFVPKGPINNIPALVQILAWRRPGDKPLSEPIMVKILTHICVTQPQWVKTWLSRSKYLHKRDPIVHLTGQAMGCLLWIQHHIYLSLQWHHNECNVISSHQPHDCLLNYLFSHRSKKTTKLCITGLCVCSCTDQRKHQSYASLAFVRGIHRWPVNSPYKGPVTRKMIPFDDVIMVQTLSKRCMLL